MSEIDIPNKFKSLRGSLLPGQYRRKILQTLYDNGSILHDIDLREAISSQTSLKQSNEEEQEFKKKYLASVASLKFSGYIIIDEKTRYVLMSDPCALLRFDMDEGRMRSNTIRSWIALTASVLTAAFAIFG